MMLNEIAGEPVDGWPAVDTAPVGREPAYLHRLLSATEEADRQRRLDMTVDYWGIWWTHFFLPFMGTMVVFFLVMAVLAGITSGYW